MSKGGDKVVGESQRGRGLPGPDDTVKNSKRRPVANDRGRKCPGIGKECQQRGKKQRGKEKNQRGGIRA